MSKKVNKSIFNLYSKKASLAVFGLLVLIYYVGGFINSNYATYKQPSLFQIIYLLLALFALTCFILEVISIKRNVDLLGKILAIIVALFGFLVICTSLLGAMSVNFL